MMDDATPRQIRARITKAFTSKGEDPLAELERMVRKAKGEAKPDKKEIENLLLLRDALAKGSRNKRVRARRKTPSRSKTAR